MQAAWTDDQLIESWTLLDDDRLLLSNKSGSTRLGFAVLLKFFEVEARFPLSAGEVPGAAVRFVAAQLGVAAEEFARYDWSGRTVKYHRAQIREFFGFREPSEADEALLAGWLAREVCPFEMREAPLREALLARCRADRVEPPGRLERIVGSARSRFEQRFCDETLARLGTDGVARLEALVADDDGRRVLAELKADPGQAGLETMLREIEKAHRRQVGWSAVLTRSMSSSPPVFAFHHVEQSPAWVTSAVTPRVEVTVVA